MGDYACGSVPAVDDGEGVPPALTGHPWKLVGDRYSPNLSKWCAKNGKMTRNEVYRHVSGQLYIGWLDDGHLIGSRLWQVLTSGGRAEAFCWPAYGKELTLLPAFWVDYARIGRCAIDTDHTRHFISDDGRWSENGDQRTCTWCGHQQRRERWVESVQRERWRSAAAPTVTPSGYAAALGCEVSSPSFQGE